MRGFRVDVFTPTIAFEVYFFHDGEWWKKSFPRASGHTTLQTPYEREALEMVAELQGIGYETRLIKVTTTKEIYRGNES